MLVDKKGAEHPSYLAYLCENLRQFGDYSLVTKRIQLYPSNFDDLLHFLLKEAYDIIDNRPLADAVTLIGSCLNCITQREKF